MEILQAVKLAAISNVIGRQSRKDGEPLDAEGQSYQLRMIFRWYSRTFYTPLHQVYELPLLEVLRHYYESTYEDLEEVDLEDERRRLCETPDEALARERQGAEDAAADEDFYKQIESQVAAETRTKRGTALPSGPKRSFADGMQSAERIVADEQLPAPRGPALREPTIAGIEPPPRAYVVEFVDEAEFERGLDGLGAFDQPKKP